MSSAVNTSLGHRPNGPWSFDAAVTGCFEDMLRRSIPQYDVMRALCFDLACRYIQPRKTVLDLGCSRGDALAPLVDRFGAHNRFVGVEISEPMLQAARERFDGLIRCGIVDIRGMDLRREYPAEPACVTLAVLTVQFTPIEYRQRLIRQVWEHTEPGGAFVMVEKTLGATAGIDSLMVDSYYTLKEANGYSRDDIERKRMSLEGVLVPVTARWNEDLLRAAGFSQVDCFWRWMNFAGWVAVKD